MRIADWGIEPTTIFKIRMKNDLMGDLKQLQAVRMTLDGKNYLIRTDFVGSAYQAFLAAGVKIPPRVQPIGMA
jgi:hypothetical protein